MNDAEIVTQKTKQQMILKLAGELRFNSALSLEKALKSIEPGQALYFDMAQITLMDSTIIGTMIKFLLDQNQRDPTFKERTFFLSLNPDLNKMLTQIGFKQFVQEPIGKKPVDLDAGVITRFEPYSTDKEKLENAVLEAHDLLSKVDPSDDNFKNVINVIRAHRLK